MLKKVLTNSKKDMSFSKTEELKALYADHANRIREVEQSTMRYHRNVGYIQTYLTALSSLATYIYLTNNIEFFKEALEQGSHHLEIIFALSLLTFFLFFLHATMMDTLYMLMSNGKYIAVLENKINKLIGKPILQWENKVIPFVLTDQWWVVNGSIRPQPLVFMWTSFLFIFAIVALCFVAYKYAYNYADIYVVLTLFIGFFHLWQWVKLMFVGNEFLKNSIFSMFGLDAFKEWDTDVYRYVIAPLTVLLGFCVFAIASLQTNTFFTTQTHPFGLIAIPSIWIGDLIILPLLNRAVYDVFRAYKGSYIYLAVLTIVSMSISFLTMASLHYAWSQDDYRGFMDTKFGELSDAGWWHYFFSSIELGFIVATVILGISGIVNKHRIITIYFVTFVKYLMIFTSIAILDFFFQFIILSVVYDYFSGSIANYFYERWMIFLPFVASLIMYFIVKKSKNNLETN